MNIPQIRITPYNHHANGVVERGHFIIHEALIKACKGKLTNWPLKVPEILFADWITVNQVTGSSPFQLLCATDLLLPLDLAEATFLVEEFRSGMQTEDLLVMRAWQLEKHPDDVARAAEILRKARFASKEQFKRRFIKQLSRKKYEPGELVLVRNTAIEMLHDRKHKPRYLGPFEVFKHTNGRNYKLRELDGATLQYKYAAFRILPYITQDHEFMHYHLQIDEGEQSNGDSEFESGPEDSDLENWCRNSHYLSHVKFIRQILTLKKRVKSKLYPHFSPYAHLMGQPTFACQYCARATARMTGQKLRLNYATINKVHPIYDEPECNNTLSFPLNLVLTNKPILSFSEHRNLSSPASEATKIYELDWVKPSGHKYRSNRQSHSRCLLIETIQIWTSLVKLSIFPFVLPRHLMSRHCRAARWLPTTTQ